MTRYAFRRHPEWGIIDLRFVSADYKLAAGEEEGEGDDLPVQPMPRIVPPKVARLDDVIAVLTDEQKRLIEERVATRSEAIGATPLR